MNKIKILFMILFYVNTSFAQGSMESYWNELDESAVSEIDAGPVSIMSNPGLLVKAEKKQYGIYLENRYLLKEFTSLNAIGMFPLGRGQVMAIQWKRGGLQEYHMDKIEMSYGMLLHGKNSIGLSIGIKTLSVLQKKKNYLPTASLGLYFELNTKTDLGLVVSNGWEPFLKAVSEEKATTVFKIGYGYKPSENIKIKIDFTKPIYGEWDFNVGTSIGLNSTYMLQYGVNVNRFSHHIATTILKKRISYRISASYHPLLGFSSGFGFFNSKKK